MSDTSAKPCVQNADAESLKSRLDHLVELHAGQRVPIQLQWLLTLAQRLDSQPLAVREFLSKRLSARIGQLEEHVQHCAQAALATPQPPTPTPPSALARLNAASRQPAHTTHTAHPRLRETSPSERELRSVSRFRQTWVKVSAQSRVNQALQREPANAGPLNSHMLVLRTIDLMNGLSPDYLAHFVVQLETLLWLEEAQPRFRTPSAKPESKSRSRKPQGNRSSSV